jgi:predicted TIM-barrel fold metal-dependent hydrolase
MPDARIVDIHAHTAFPDPSVAERLIPEAARHGVRTMVLLGDVMAFGEFPSEEQVRRINDDTAAAVRRFPQAFVGFCHVNPEHDRKAIVAEIDRCVKGLGMRGIKLWVSVVARDRRLDPILERAGELCIPVLHHSWYKTVWKTKCESDPSDIADLASRFPGVNIVMAHLSGCAERGIQDVKPHPNVLVDTSGSQPVAGMVEYAVRELGADRLVYGSDVAGRDFTGQIGRILGADIGEEDRRKILYLNAERLLKLGGAA